LRLFCLENKPALPFLFLEDVYFGDPSLKLLGLEAIMMLDFGLIKALVNPSSLDFKVSGYLLNIF
jgi:hypothetical protein